MAVTVKGSTIVMTAQDDSFDDWVFVKECRWQGADSAASCLVQDRAKESVLLKSSADQDEFIDTVRPELWYKGLYITTLAGGAVNQGEIVVYVK